MQAGDTALIWGSNNGHTKVVEVLLSAKADPNFQSSAGATALTAAAKNGYVEICEMLISSNADPDLQNCVCF